MSDKAKGLSATLIAAVYFGFVPLLMKTVYASGGNSFTAAFLRFFFSLPLLFLYLKVNKVDLKLSKKELKQILIMTVFGYAGTTILIFSAYNYLPSGMATSIHFLYPTVTVVGLMVFCGEKIKPEKLICVGLCLFGIIMLYNGEEGQVSIVGILLAFASSCTYGFYTIFLGRSSIQEMEPLKRLFYMHVVGSVMMGVIGVVSGRLEFSMAPIGWGIMFLTANLTSFIGALGYQIGVKYIGAENAAMLSTFEPITSIIIGVIVYDEAMTLRIALGFCAILLSTLIIARSED